MTTNPVMSITDEQIAEIVRMNSELNELRCVVRYIRVDEVEALISRLRAAERDAERYQEMREVVCDEKGVTPESYDAEVDRILAMKGEQQ